MTQQLQAFAARKPARVVVAEVGHVPVINPYDMGLMRFLYLPRNPPKLSSQRRNEQSQTSLHRKSRVKRLRTKFPDCDFDLDWSRKRKRPKTPDSGNDTAGEETPDTDDYEGRSGEEMVVPAKARAEASKRHGTRVKSRQVALVLEQVV